MELYISKYGCKVLGYFGPKYSKSGPTKYRRQGPTKIRSFNKKQENDAIVHHAVDEIILQENHIISLEDDAHDKIDYGGDENYLYDIDHIILDDKKVNKE